MKYLIAILACSLLIIAPASAHRGNGLPFIKINDTYTEPYPILSNSVPGFVTPQDIGLTVYEVNKAITFDIDRERLLMTSQVPENAIYHWDFGDGSKATGQRVTHTYAKIGSEEVQLSAEIPGSGQPQPLEQILVHITDSLDYKVPVPVITVSNTNGHNGDTLVANFTQEVSLSVKDQSGSAPITSYYWDLGDGQDSKSATLTHRFDASQSILAPMVRLTDENGFYTDAFIWLRNSHQTSPEPGATPTQPSKKSSKNAQASSSATIIAMLVVILAVLRRKRKPTKP